MFVIVATPGGCMVSNISQAVRIQLLLKHSNIIRVTIYIPEYKLETLITRIHLSQINSDQVTRPFLCLSIAM